MDAGSALDTFLLINHADAILIISDGIHRTNFLTRTLQMGNGVIGTGL